MLRGLPKSSRTMATVTPSGAVICVIASSVGESKAWKAKVVANPRGLVTTRWKALPG
jgi:hypothetical protein